MNKGFRQGQILKIIGARQIFTQEELARALKELGIPATQVTLSRDIRELGLVKTADGYRQLPAEASGPALDDVIGEYVQDVLIAQNLVIVKTLPANASTVAVALDSEELEEIVGTIAGDDTVLVVTPDSATAERLRARLLGILSA
jgi:transcriptional regulator of arginine metabolism